LHVFVSDKNYLTHELYDPIHCNILARHVYV